MSQFERIVAEHQEMVFRMLVRLTGTREHVDDLAQDVFLRLYRALPSFRGDALLTTYLHRIVVNVAQDEWKRRQRMDQRHTSISDETSGWADRLHHPSPNAEQELSTRELQLRVDAELNKLSAVERSILVLYHQEERSYQQIAESLQMPIGTVRTHLHRGRNKLRAALERKGGWR
ncbi:MAG: sigma-70 family RNA polymerase sigma factor [Terriglobus sp.]